MTGVDIPGKSATHNASSFDSSLSGRPVSSDIPLWSGPRQLSQPFTAASTGTTITRQPAIAGTIHCELRFKFSFNISCKLPLVKGSSRAAPYRPRPTQNNQGAILFNRSNRFATEMLLTRIIFCSYPSPRLHAILPHATLNQLWPIHRLPQPRHRTPTSPIPRNVFPSSCATPGTASIKPSAAGSPTSASLPTSSLSCATSPKASASASPKVG